MATGSYDANGIWQYGEDDNIALFSDLLNLATASTSDAFTDDRARIATLEGGSLAGLIPIAPSSVVIATGTGAASTNGKVSFTGATTVSLNDVFVSAYDNYFILYEGVSSVDTGITMRLRAAGTDNAGTSSYATARTYNSNATVGANQGTNTLYTIFPVSLRKHLFTFNLFKPALAVNTHGICQASSTSTDAASTNWGQQVGHFSHYVASAYDGLTLIATTGNITGTIQVFGYND